MNTQVERKKVKIWKIMVFPVLMFGFAFSMIPLYNTICDITGFNGRSASLQKSATYNENINHSYIDKNRLVTVTFLTTVANGLPITFKADKPNLNIVPGRMYEMEFEVQNRSDEMLIGQAIPSVSPPQAAIHFVKMECFCFQKQEFAPSEKIKMPIRFTVNPQMDKNVQDVSLSYAFYLIEKRAKQASDTSVIRTHNQDFTKNKIYKNNRS